MRKPLIIFIVVLVIVGGVTAFFLNSKPNQLSSAEREKALTKILGRQANLNPNEKTGNLSYNGQNASFIYPAKAKAYNYVDPESKKSEAKIERFSFDIQNPRLILNYTVEKDPADSRVEDYPAVKLRLDPSFGYEKKEFIVDSQAGLVFSKPGNGENRAEKSGFLLRNGLIYTISVTGTNERDTSDLFKLITESFTFNN